MSLPEHMRLWQNLSMRAIDHVRYLAERIGPRGSTMPGEVLAAEYARAQLEQLQLQPHVERFRSGRSAWLPVSLFWILVLASCGLFWFVPVWGTPVAFVLSGLALGSILLEMSFRTNPIRWVLPRGPSQNVWARIDAHEDVRDDVVLVAHLDTHRTPLVFSSDRWVRLFERLVPIGMACAVLLWLCFGAAMVIAWPGLALVAIAPAAVAASILLLTLQADTTPYTAGANDNASGVGVVLSLAERLVSDPLAHTTVWILFTGCEEVGCGGAEAFLRAHRRDVGRAAWISIDTVGSADAVPVYLMSETFVGTTKSDPGLVRMAEEICVRRSELGVYPITMKGAYTDGAIGGKHGLRVLTFESRRPDGTLGEWHRPTDVVANVSEDCMEKTEVFLTELLGDLDAAATESSESFLKGVTEVGDADGSPVS